MYFSQSMTTVFVSVLLAISKVGAVPMPQGATPGLIPLRLTPSSPFNGTISNTTGPTNRTVIPLSPFSNSTGQPTNNTVIPTALYSNTTSRFANNTVAPYSITNHTVTPYSNSTGNLTTYGAHFTNRTTSGTFGSAANVTYPWMANRTVSGPSGTESSPEATNKPVKPSATVTYKPFEGSAVSVAQFSGSWTLLVAVIGAMAML